MKKIVITLIFVVVAVKLCGAQTKANQYTISAELVGNVDGKMVYLRSSADDKSTIDSTSVKDGKFTFIGHVDYPQFFNIIIVKNKDDYGQPIIPLFVENSKITISAVLDSIPKQGYNQYGFYHYNAVKISGSKSQDKYASFLKNYAPLSNRKNELFMVEYNQVLDAQKNNVHRPISEKLSNATKTDEAQKERDVYVRKFILDNSDNMVGLYIAKDYLTLFSQKEINQILQNFTPEIINSEAGKSFASKASEVRKSAPGAKFIDFAFKDSKGKTIKLSDRLGKGKFVLLEFWASWCVPCRAEIPHLKEVYKLYHPLGFDMISVSMDTDKEKWLKAVQDERMDWLQISDLKGLKGGVSKLYNFYGIPACFLIDDKGYIVGTEMRGAWLDKKLIELYGNKFASK